MPVENSKQNKHGWWGTLTLDYDQLPLKRGQQCIFVKTNKVSHYVAQGTFILKVRVLLNLETATNDLKSRVPDRATQIQEDLGSITIECKLPIVEILEIDDQETSPLTKKLNEYTRRLFMRDSTLPPEDQVWLENQNASEIGRLDIEAGMRLP